MYVVLAGGVGAARFLLGLVRVVDPGQVTVVANTADDKEFFGLHVSPDIDTNLYTLAGIANPATGWGIANDTFHALDMLQRYGHDTWFALGDKDLATHIHRTWRLRQGYTLSEVTRELAGRFGLEVTLLPMTDDPVATYVSTPRGELHFQDYLVKYRAEDPVLGVTVRGAGLARPAPGVIEAIARARGILIPPSNPIVSVGTILAIPGIREAIEKAGAPVVAVSPIIAGKTVKGPADKLMHGLGYEVSAYGVARCYDGLLDGMIIDQQDHDQVPRLQQLGLLVEATNTLLDNDQRRQKVAAMMLDMIDRLANK